MNYDFRVHTSDDIPAMARPGPEDGENVSRAWSIRAVQHSFTRFAGIGVFCYALDSGLLFLAHGVLGIRLPLATSFAYLATFFVNFWLNRTVVFRAGDRVTGQLVRYLTLAGVNYLLTVALVTGLAAAGLYYLIGRAVAAGISAAVNYLAYRFWVFR